MLYLKASASSHARLQIGGPGYLTWVTGNRVVPFDENAPPSNFTQRDLVAAVEGSLRRLQTDYIDLYQLHWPARYVPVFGFKQYRPENIRECLDFEEQVGNALQLQKIVNAVGKSRQQFVIIPSFVVWMTSSLLLVSALDIGCCFLLCHMCVFGRVSSRLNKC
jgi:hypothetical protein